MPPISSVRFPNNSIAEEVLRTVPAIAIISRTVFSMTNPPSLALFSESCAISLAAADESDTWFTLTANSSTEAAIDDVASFC